MLTALLQYHVLVGAHPSTALNMSLYAHSMLTNTTYTNVTNGQVVQLSKMGNKVMAMSGLKEMSMSTTMDVMFTGGVVHVIDKVLTMPMVRIPLHHPSFFILESSDRLTLPRCPPSPPSTPASPASPAP